MRKTIKFSAGAFVIATGWTVLALLAMSYGSRVNWPDFVHVNYGFPLTFAVHTLNTIAGPVNKWSLDSNALGLDVLFWIIGMFVITFGFAYLINRRALNQNPQLH